MTPLNHYLLVAALLFSIGLAGALTRRNAILVLIGIELMLNAANLNFIAFWRFGPSPPRSPASCSPSSPSASPPPKPPSASPSSSPPTATHDHRPGPDELHERLELQPHVFRTAHIAIPPHDLDRPKPLADPRAAHLRRRHHRSRASSAAAPSPPRSPSAPWPLSFLLSLAAFAHTLTLAHRDAPETFNFRWFQFGNEWLSLGWMLDPLTAVMLVMVTFVGLLIFIYSIGYMAHDENFTRFFCFLALFAGAMLGVIIANSLLLLFMCWEIVGLTSYLLIGFWYHKPRAAAAAKKAFITTRIGDLGFLLGMVWLYAQTGTLLFYDGGAGALEPSALAHLVAHTTVLGLTASSAIGILIFCGAAGKSGQVPLHVWLPDAMEGPTPVSALIHAATMVAAGVFLIARIYPLMSAHATAAEPATPTVALAGRHLGRRHHRPLRRHHRRRPVRHQAHPRLLHRLPARLHDDGPRRRRRRRRHVPPHHPRLLQGAALPRRGLRHPRLLRRAGHPPHGRPAQVHAHHLR